MDIERFRIAIDLVALLPSSATMPATSGRVLRQIDAPSGATILHAAELPGMANEGSRPAIAIVAAGSTAHWRRASIHYSVDDGTTWIPAGTTAAPGVVGAVAAGAGAAPATLEDRRHTIELLLAHDGMMLTSADAAARDRGENLALVGDELLQFGTVRQIGPRRWRVSDLWRGRRGTLPAPISAGARFVLIEPDALLSIAPDAAVGARVRVMARGVGDDSGVEEAVVLDGASILPPAPVRLSARIADGVLTLQWRRRSRTDWSWRDEVNTLLGEEREAYQVTITTAASEPCHVATARPELVVPLATLGSAPVHVAVRQIGNNGASRAALLTL